ncbi:GNAT family N-acetyltransferase [Lacibacterium aquatile]|uniref:GNAT family N-acetyltransferase n=1 Tax=Lacibacterium aquatile TaxID=1168082 RepID=A0ABW5DTE9_9PROT
MYSVTLEQPQDAPAVETLLDTCFGPDRTRKTSYRFREGVPAVENLCYVARNADGEVVGTLRFWPVKIAETEGLLLGPLAVSPDLRGSGLGAQLMEAALARATELGHGIMVLVSDLADFYGKFGFRPAGPMGLQMPGEKTERLYALALKPGALNHVEGLILPFVPAEAPALPIPVAA